MTRLRIVLLRPPLLGLAACGGGGGASTATPGTSAQRSGTTPAQAQIRVVVPATSSTASALRRHATIRRIQHRRRDDRRVHVTPRAEPDGRRAKLVRHLGDVRKLYRDRRRWPHVHAGLRAAVNSDRRLRRHDVRHRTGERNDSGHGQPARHRCNPGRRADQRHEHRCAVRHQRRRRKRHGCCSADRRSSPSTPRRRT